MSKISALRDVATMLALVVGSVSAVVAVLALRLNSRVQKAQFVTNLTNDFFGDSDLQRFYYKVDYERFLFDVAQFKGSEDERHLQALLYRYNMVGRLVRLGAIAVTDVEFLVFELVQVFKNSEVRRYLAWLNDEYEEYGGYGKNKRRRPFDDACWLLERLDAGLTT
jgi:hypothetical protein